MADLSIRLFNHLGNGGSFTLNGNKTISVSVVYNGVSASNTFSLTRHMTCYYDWCDWTGNVAVGGYTITSVSIPDGTEYDWAAIIGVTPKPSSVSISSSTHSRMNGNYSYNTSHGGGNIHKEGADWYSPLSGASFSSNSVTFTITIK